MATFTLIVNGTTLGKLLGPPSESHSSCQSVFDIVISATTSDSMQLDFTPSAGYTDYANELDVGAGFVSISATSHPFTFGTEATLRVILYNDGSTDTVTITIDGENFTNPDTDSVIVNRLSIGLTC